MSRTVRECLRISRNVRKYQGILRTVRGECLRISRLSSNIKEIQVMSGNFKLFQGI